MQLVLNNLTLDSYELQNIFNASMLNCVTRQASQILFQMLYQGLQAQCQLQRTQNWTLPSQISSLLSSLPLVLSLQSLPLPTTSQPPWQKCLTTSSEGFLMDISRIQIIFVSWMSSRPMIALRN